MTKISSRRLFRPAPPSLFFAAAFLLLFAVANFGVVVRAQFTCTMSGANDETSCVDGKDDDGSHCVWCSLASFGFCVNEAAAEAAEQSLPAVSCDRYSGNDDDDTKTDDDDSTPKTDDETPSTDDRTTTDDDSVKPNDDDLPSDYWNCLVKGKDQKTCESASEDCVWCTAKKQQHSGVCMSGPSAESAKTSAFYDCADRDKPEPPPPPSRWFGDWKQYLFGREDDDEPRNQQQQADVTASSDVSDPYDATCVQSYLQNPTRDGCLASADRDGRACRYCSLAGMTNLCLTEEQADMGSQLGVTCDSNNEKEEGDDSEDAISVDEEEEIAAAVADPLDPSCIMAYLQDQSPEACKEATDQEGNKCEWCSLQQYQLCLTAEQAEMGQQAGVTCDEEGTAATVRAAGNEMLLPSNQDEEGAVFATKYVRG